MNADRTTETMSPNSISQMASAFQRSRILLSAYELGIFTALGDQTLSAGDVSRALNTDARATERLMNALCALDLLEKKQGKFSNTPQTRRFLVANNPDYMAGLMHTNHLWNAWSHLTEAVRQGKAPAADPINDRGETWLNAFIAAMHARARQQAPALISLLDLSQVTRVLDVGGGSGIFSTAFANAKPGLHATVFDLPNVVPLTRQYIRQANLADRIDTAIGDYTRDSLGKSYDLVFLSAIIHSNSYDQNAALIQKCADALTPGGQVVVVDFIMNEDRTQPAMGALFALNMLVATESGDTFTESEVRAWMKTAGLSRIARIDAEAGPPMMIGYK